MKKTSKLYAVVHGKCPQCRRGDIFSGSMYGFNIQRTNTNCSHCGFRFEIEPGYFYAAMYVSYAMNCAEMISLGVAAYVLSGGWLDYDSFWMYITVIFTGCLILAPFNYRYSRVMLLHFLSPKIKYKPAYDKP
ncbi:DUF983 domain-containing protein [Pedobacter gandavensis]|uniref:DUF983 domain-containing protein n=1 Tax=Pedobacter gandavensis TaxID=2679963 RepID=A0ABR6F0U4_9SPHI|nr:DUF983 domain-containing protein [Pedobacter gandavensis]MBB2151134.1 DUF983 domain-containing protein [Pedobacter gandavensis]